MARRIPLAPREKAYAAQRKLQRAIWNSDPSLFLALSGGMEKAALEKTLKGPFLSPLVIRDGGSDRIEYRASPSGDSVALGLACSLAERGSLDEESIRAFDLLVERGRALEGAGAAERLFGLAFGMGPRGGALVDFLLGRGLDPRAICARQYPVWVDGRYHEEPEISRRFEALGFEDPLARILPRTYGNRASRERFGLLRSELSQDYLEAELSPESRSRVFDELEQRLRYEAEPASYARSGFLDALRGGEGRDSLATLLERAAAEAVRGEAAKDASRCLELLYASVLGLMERARIPPNHEGARLYRLYHGCRGRFLDCGETADLQVGPNRFVFASNLIRGGDGVIDLAEIDPRDGQYSRTPELMFYPSGSVFSGCLAEPCRVKVGGRTVLAAGKVAPVYIYMPYALAEIRFHPSGEPWRLILGEDTSLEAGGREIVFQAWTRIVFDEYGNVEAGTPSDPFVVSVAGRSARARVDSYHEVSFYGSGAVRSFTSAEALAIGLGGRKHPVDLAFEVELYPDGSPRRYRSGGNILLRGGGVSGGRCRLPTGCGSDGAFLSLYPNGDLREYASGPTGARIEDREGAWRRCSRAEFWDDPARPRLWRGWSDFGELVVPSGR
jgi:hypothetical protein